MHQSSPCILSIVWTYRLLEYNENIEKRSKHSVCSNVQDSSKAQVRSLHKLDFMSCLYTTADCLTNKMSELKLHVKNSKPKILGITEVKPTKLRYNLQNC